MVKPEACRGCPLYQDGAGFVPDEVIPGAPVFVLGQNPGEDEVREGRPFVGKTGRAMEATFFPAAGLRRGENVSIGNTLRCRWRGANELPPKDILDSAVAHCRRAHEHIPPDTKLVVAQGALAWRATGNETAITSWRGYLAPQPYRGHPVYGVLHLADATGYDPGMRLPSYLDWQKIPRILTGEWPRPIPHRTIAGLPEDAAIAQDWLDAARHSPAVVVDTEYDPKTRQIWLMSLCGPDPQMGGLQLWVPRRGDGACGEGLKQLLSQVRVVFHNAMADLPALHETFGIVHVPRYDDTMLAHAVLWSELPHDLEFLASLYGWYPKLKHLKGVNPTLYNWGDTIETAAVWEALQRELAADPASAWVYTTQSLPLVPILLDRMQRGIRTNQARAAELDEGFQAQAEGAQHLAQAYTGWPFNVGSEQHLKRWLHDVEGIPPQTKHRKVTIAQDAVARLRMKFLPFDAQEEEQNPLTVSGAVARIADGAHPVLEARAVYTAALQMHAHYTAPLRAAERIYPEFLIHAQATGRWSINRPPLAQFPHHVRELIRPDPGEAWIAWDWDQIELRLLTALCGEETWQAAFDRGEDVHTLNAMDLFDLAEPPAKDDPRRVFAKRFVYRLIYGGAPAAASTIPGADKLGMRKETLVQKSVQFLAKRRQYLAWRTTLEAELRAAAIPTVRTFDGRRRRFMYSTGTALVREGLNQPMQGGVAGILNRTVIRICHALPDASLVYTMHDAGTVAVPADRVKAVDPIIRAIVQEPYQIGGRWVVFPATFQPVVYGE